MRPAKRIKLTSDVFSTSRTMKRKIEHVLVRPTSELINPIHFTMRSRYPVDGSGAHAFEHHID